MHCLIARSVAGSPPKTVALVSRPPTMRHVGPYLLETHLQDFNGGEHCTLTGFLPRHKGLPQKMMYREGTFLQVWGSCGLVINIRIPENLEFSRHKLI